MFSIVITERGGSLRQLDFDAPELTIGRLEENEIVLPRGNVSKRHARVQFRDGGCVVRDLKSTNGTYVNGRKISGPTVLSPGDKVYIGDFILALRDSRAVENDARRTRELRPAEARSRASAGTPPDSHEAAPPPAPPVMKTQLDLPRPNLGPNLAASEDDAGEPQKRPVAPPKPAPAAGARAAFPQPWALKNATGRSLSPAAPGARAPGTRRDTAPMRVQSPMLAGSGASTPDTPQRVVPPIPPRPPRAAAGAPELATPSVAVQAAASAPEVPAPPPLESSEESATNPALVSGEWPAGPRARMHTPAYGMSVAQTKPQEMADTNPSAASAPPTLRLHGALQTLMERLAAEIDLSDPRERVFGAEHQLSLERLLDHMAREGVIEPDVDRRFLVQAAISEAVGLGPLDRLLNNRTLRELVVQGPSRILADLGNGLLPVSSFFSSSKALDVAVRRLCARAGHQLGREPTVDLALPDGSSLVVMQAPLATRSTVLSLRRPPRTTRSLDELEASGVLTSAMVQLLTRALELRLNVLVVGAPGSGVSTLLCALASHLEDAERVVSIERSPSLALRQPHAVGLRAGASGYEALPELLQHAGRLRAERLVIDDLGADSLPAALPVIAGFRGVLAGLHLQASSNQAAQHQLESLPFGHACPVAGSLAGAAFQLRVHLVVDDGTRKVVDITELRTTGGGELDLARLFRNEAPGESQADRVPSFMPAVAVGQ